MSAPGNLPQRSGGVREPNPPMVNCDLCEWPMAVPPHCIESGEIVGLLVCTACIETELEAQVQ